MKLSYYCQQTSKHIYKYVHLSLRQGFQECGPCAVPAVCLWAIEVEMWACRYDGIIRQIFSYTPTHLDTIVLVLVCVCVCPLTTSKFMSASNNNAMVVVVTFEFS